MCIVSLLELAGCSEYDSTKTGKAVEFEFEGNVFVSGSSAYRDGAYRFTTSFISEDGLDGFILYGEDIYWKLAQELGTDEKELHEFHAIGSKIGGIYYAEIDGVVCFDYRNDSVAKVAPLSRWYSLSES
jgi:hypothetical protein